MAFYDENSNQHSDGRDSEVTIDSQEQLEGELIDDVIFKIREDLAYQDVSAIFELLRFCPTENLIQFLPEEQWKKFGKLNK